MKEFKGTQGEWRVQEQFDAPNLIIDKENGTEWYALSSYVFGNDKIIGETKYVTCVNRGYPSVNVLGEMRANAKLIAASKDLLEALQETEKDLCVLWGQVKHLEESNPIAEGISDLIQDWRDRNKKAINKALS
jgi:hypothetical protein